MDDRTQHLLALLDRDGKQLHRLIARLTLRHDVAEDLMQELFMRLSGSRGFWQATNRLAYAKRVAIHLAYDWRRRQTRRSETQTEFLEPEAEGPSLLERLVDSEQIEEVLEAVGGLSKLSRDCLLLRYLEEETYESIAKQCGKTPHQVRAHCHKAVVRLREMLTVETGRGE